MYFCQIENFACGEINERNFSNPHPCLVAANNKVVYNANVYGLFRITEWKQHNTNVSRSRRAWEKLQVLSF